MVYHKVNIGFFILYMVLMTTLMIYSGVGITPDRYALVLILGSLFIHKTRRFLIDFLPFLFILISYDFLRSLAPFLNPRVHYQEMIDFDKILFGTNPTIFLQNNFYTQGKISWIDYFSIMFYFLHFALPLAFGFILWIKKRDFFKKFSTAILILSYSAFFTFVLFPAAPPWLAERKGYLPGVVKIVDVILKSFPDKLHLPSIYHNFNPNQVAAMPSLHAAYPLLILFLGVKFFGKKWWWFTFYVLGCWFSLVYLGEHYVADIALGVIYTIIVFFGLRWYTRKDVY